MDFISWLLCAFVIAGSAYWFAREATRARGPGVVTPAFLQSWAVFIAAPLYLLWLDGTALASDLPTAYLLLGLPAALWGWSDGTTGRTA